MSLDRLDADISNLIVPYCSLFDSSADAIIILHRNIGVVYQNSAFRSQFGDSVVNLTDISDVHNMWGQNLERVWSSNEDVFTKDNTTGIEFRSLKLNDEIFCMVSVPTINGLTLAVSPKRTSGKGTMNKADKSLIDSVLVNAHQAIMILIMIRKSM